MKQHCFVAIQYVSVFIGHADHRNRLRIGSPSACKGKSVLSNYLEVLYLRLIILVCASFWPFLLNCSLFFVSSVSEIFPQVTLNFAGGASMILRPQDYLLQQNSIVSQHLVAFGISQKNCSISPPPDYIRKHTDLICHRVRHLATLILESKTEADICYTRLHYGESSYSYSAMDILDWNLNICYSLYSVLQLSILPFAFLMFGKYAMFCLHRVVLQCGASAFRKFRVKELPF